MKEERRRPLGFGSRAKRGSVVGNDASTARKEVIQGPELGSKKEEVSRGTASFLDRSSRVGHPSMAVGTEGPSPQDYVIPSTLSGAAVTSSFRSSSSRLSPTRNHLVPGPGSYELNTVSAGSLPRALRRRRSDESWVRVHATVPSIPSKNDLCGYVDAGDGTMIRQKLAEDAYSGVGQDSPGPGYYDPKYSGTSSKPRTMSVDIGRSTGHHQKNSDATAATGTGRKASAPFHDTSLYETPHCGATTLDDMSDFGDVSMGKPRGGKVIYRHRRPPLKSHMFTSTTKRGEGCSATQSPGPGAYSLPSSISDTQASEKGRRAKVFLTSERRFSSKDPLAEENNPLPGPGSYDACSTSPLLRRAPRRMRINSGLTMDVGFDSTSSRFSGYAGATFDSNLGPGAYSLPGMSDLLLQKFAKRGKKMGRTSRKAGHKERGVGGGGRGGAAYILREKLEQALLQKENEQGGGSDRRPSTASTQNAQKERRRRSERRTTSSFASQTMRFDDREIKAGKSKLGPGQYHKEVVWGNTGGSVRMVPSGKSGGGRLNLSSFSPVCTSETVGPGRYDAWVSSFSPSYYKITVGRRGVDSLALGESSILHANTTANHPSSLPTSTPGPGEYYVSKNLLKPTYNLQIAEMAAAGRNKEEIARIF